MRLTNDELIDEFYKKIEKDFPQLSFEEIKEICFSPWKFLKECIESNDLPKIRFKYFGTFQVYKGRAENMLYNLKERFKYNKIDKKQYYHLKEILENYLNRIKNET